MSSRLVAVAVLLSCAVFLVSCKPKADIVTMTVGGEKLYVEIAKTPAERERGLMFRKSMPMDHGMLFIFPYDQQLSFWMKNTDIPLAIAYISSTGTIKEIYHMRPHSLEAIQSIHAVRYALEVNEGLFAKLGVKPGDKVIFPAKLPQARQ